MIYLKYFFTWKKILIFFFDQLILLLVLQREYF